MYRMDVFSWKDLSRMASEVVIKGRVSKVEERRDPAQVLVDKGSEDRRQEATISLIQWPVLVAQELGGDSKMNARRRVCLSVAVGRSCSENGRKETSVRDTKVGR